MDGEWAEEEEERREEGVLGKEETANWAVWFGFGFLVWVWAWPAAFAKKKWIPTPPASPPSATGSKPASSPSKAPTSTAAASTASARPGGAARGASGVESSTRAIVRPAAVATVGSGIRGNAVLPWTVDAPAPAGPIRGDVSGDPNHAAALTALGASTGRPFEVTDHHGGFTVWYESDGDVVGVLTLNADEDYRRAGEILSSSARRPRRERSRRLPRCALQ